MPELPDVEGFRRVLDRTRSSRIEAVQIRDAGVLRDVSAPKLRRTLRGHAFGTPRRHGKWLIAPVRQPKRRHRKAEPSLLFHFGMTGALHWFTGDAEPLHQHDRIVVRTDRGELRYRDMRKLQGVRLAADDTDVETLLRDAGPDAADVSFEDFVQRLQRKRQLKPALMDQSVLSGLGNLLVDEILWRARIHPERPMAELSRSEYRRIHRSMRTVLRQSIPTGRVPPRPSWLTGRRDDQDAQCPRCGTKLRHTRVGGRHTAWCPQCQPS